MRNRARLVTGIAVVGLIGFLLAGVQAPAQETVGTVDGPAVRQGAPAKALKRLGKALDPVERLQRQVETLEKKLAAQQAEIDTLKRELSSATRTFQQFSILDGHPGSHISKSEWDRLPARSQIRVRPR